MPNDTEQDSKTEVKKPKAPHHPLNTGPRPHNDFAGKAGKSAKPSASKGRNFRHQGR